MAKYLIIIVLFAFSLASFSQVNLKRVSNEFCECFDQVIESNSDEDKELRIAKCINQKKAEFGNDIERLFDTPENQIEFIKMLAGNCVSFVEYFTKNLYKEKDLTDEEYTQNIYLILEYFSSNSEHGKYPKTVNIAFYEAGVLYNIFLNKIYPDSIFFEGVYKLQPHDSLIIFKITPPPETVEMDIKLKDDSEIAIEAIIWFKLIPDSIGHLYTRIGVNYIPKFVKPIVRQNLKKVLANYTSKELYIQDIDHLSNIILDSINRADKMSSLFSFYGLFIQDIEYPHIIEKAIESNLIDFYEQLKSSNLMKRKDALKNLFDDGSQTAYLIILTHWSKERNQEILEYILQRISKN